MNILLLNPNCFDGNQATISDPNQLTHIKSVLKAGIGDMLKIGCLGGKIGRGVLMEMSERQAVLMDVVLDTPPPKKLGVTLMLALPRPKVLRRLVMDMTAIGVNHIILVNSVRTDKSYWSSPLLARLDEFVIEGLQQGVDTVPPVITLAKRFKPFVQDELPSVIKSALLSMKDGKPDDKVGRAKVGQAVVFHPYDSVPFGGFCRTEGLPTFIAIGAEGGFVPYEIELLKSVGVVPVGLGSRILRTESAVNAVLGRYLL